MSLDGEVELELRLVPGVSGVGYADSDEGTVAQLLVSDPHLGRSVLTEAERILEISGHRPGVRLEIRAHGMPRTPLAIERQVLAIPGVRSCEIGRGGRGEVSGIRTLVDDPATAERVRRRVASLLGCDPLPPQLLVLEIMDPDGQVG